MFLKFRAGLLALSLAARALAQEAAAPAPPAAAPGAIDAAPPTPEELFKAGRDAMKQGDYATACPKFAESHRREPARGTLLNLALCEEESGRLLDAKRHLLELLDLADLDDARRAMATEHIAAIDARAPRLVFRLEPAAVERLRFTLDGRELPVPLPAEPLAVDPGRHVLRVLFPDGPARELVLDARVGAETVVAELPRSEPPPAAPNPATPVVVPPSRAPASETPSTGPGPLPYVLGGVGLAALATGLVTGILVIDRKETVEAHCVGKTCDPDGLAAGRSGKTLSAISTVTFLGGAALTGVAAYLLLSSGTEPENPQVSVALAPGGLGASVAGTFR